MPFTLLQTTAVDPIQYGMAGAVIAVVILFLRFLGDERKSRIKERDEERQDRTVEREKFLNALSEHTASINNFALRVEHCPTREKNRKLGG